MGWQSNLSIVALLNTLCMLPSCLLRSATKYLEQERDPVMREALRLQMMEFGRTPRQVCAANLGLGEGIAVGGKG